MNAHVLHYMYGGQRKSHGSQFSISTMWFLRLEGKYLNPLSHLINSFIYLFILRQSPSSPGPGMHHITHTSIKLWVLSMSTCYDDTVKPLC